MCVVCEDFRIKRCRIVELDSFRMNFGMLGDRSVTVAIKKRYSEAMLICLLDDDEIVSATPISYCPVCGEEIGGKKNDKNRE